MGFVVRVNVVWVVDGWDFVRMFFEFYIFLISRLIYMYIMF